MRRPITIAALLAVLLASALPLAAEDAVPAPAKPPETRTNRLSTERSPYLRQHMHNPVDWRPWGPEAFAAAKESDKPVFLSIGYAACHWCHVMEHETFEDQRAAAALNDAFVCVKVDREERPDVDDVYMAAVQLSTGRGGWPMSCFLLPDGRPFLARTYLRRDDVVAIAAKLKGMWTTDRERLVGAAEEIAGAVREHAAGPKLPPFTGSDAELVKAAVDQASREFDREKGGFDRVPKFPPHAHLRFFLDRKGTAGGADALAMARATLHAMAQGGVHDQVGGGFHRYSTDADWLVPHFEKMLYDNALLAEAYAAASAIGQEPAFSKASRGTLEWIVREMSVPGGGYASSLDADTEGEEGLTYTWTVEELRSALPEADARLAEQVFGASAAGNYREEASGRATGRNILHLVAPLPSLAPRLSMPLPDLAASVDRIRARLLEVRAKRAQPGRDGKVITAWNGLLVSAFARAATALPEPRYLDLAKGLATFLLEHSRENGALLRFPRGSGPLVPGFLDDHVLLADGLLDLAEATGEAKWADEAGRLAAAVLARFADPAGGFYSSASDHEALLARSKETYDSPIPSANATAIRILQRLFAKTGEARLREAADRAILAFRPLVARAPAGTMALVRAIADRETLAATGAGPSTPDATARVGPARIDAFLERDEAKPGSAVRVLLRVTLEPGWHVNPSGPVSKDRIPTSLSLETPAPVALEGLRWPAAEGGAYEGTFDVAGSLSIPKDAALGPRKVGLVFSFQPCDATSCLAPVDARLDLRLRFEATDSPPRHPSVFR